MPAGTSLVTTGLKSQVNILLFNADQILKELFFYFSVILEHVPQQMGKG